MALTLRTDSELEAALDALVKAEGTSRQEVIRRAVIDRHEQMVHVEIVGESSSRLREKWADVLDRLGTV
ncbi:ribbon-helix-helix domain-containing protein [Knoellia koreensis]|jgi:predicted transcriptional regulator|uniref:CopG family transcriptional regulator n=1 Tax=Knoellia koreensis TaxID=2730921 RepID=A0A849HR95_9MICO|nr:ribbon-helix-helix domain-containing protein [Knoellia sp. DB2414S]NNM47117.1 CopG family transcriptional regulator [Knoellia sp. DB2414S]